MRRSHKDVRCAKCRRSYGFSSDLNNWPPCPHCGAPPPDQEEIKRIDAAIEQAIRESEEEEERINNAFWRDANEDNLKAYAQGRVDCIDAHSCGKDLYSAITMMEYDRYTPGRLRLPSKGFDWARHHGWHRGWSDQCARIARREK